MNGLHSPVKSLSARILMGFLVVLALAVAGFGITLYIAKDFRIADLERVEAVGQLREADRIQEMAHVAQAKLSDYLRTGSADARNAMTASFAQLSTDLAHATATNVPRALRAHAEKTIDRIYETSLTSRHVVDSAASLSNPSAAIGQVAAQAGASTLTTNVSRLQVSIGLLASAADRLAISGDSKFMEELTTEEGRVRESADAIEADSTASPRLKKLIAALHQALQVFDESIRSLNVSLDLRTDASRRLSTLLAQVTDAATTQEALAGTRSIRRPYGPQLRATLCFPLC